jgi:hypothetical protein
MRELGYGQQLPFIVDAPSAGLHRQLLDGANDDFAAATHAPLAEDDAVAAVADTPLAQPPRLAGGATLKPPF